MQHSSGSGNGGHEDDYDRRLSSDIYGITEQVEAVLREQTIRRPYLMLGAAFSVGYVLGGGLPAFAARMLAELGMRTVMRAVFDEFGGTFVPEQPTTNARESIM